jgi:hypothetical protein
VLAGLPRRGFHHFQRLHEQAQARRQPAINPAPSADAHEAPASSNAPSSALVPFAAAHEAQAPSAAPSSALVPFAAAHEAQATPAAAVEPAPAALTYEAFQKGMMPCRLMFEHSGLVEGISHQLAKHEAYRRHMYDDGMLYGFHGHGKGLEGYVMGVYFKEWRAIEAEVSRRRAAPENAPRKVVRTEGPAPKPPGLGPEPPGSSASGSKASSSKAPSSKAPGSKASGSKPPSREQPSRKQPSREQPSRK